MAEKIVVIDGYTLNPGDLSWEGLNELGEVRVYERSEDAEVEARVRDATCVFTNKIPFSAQRIARLAKLKYIGVTATGYNVVDIAAAKERGIPVTNVPTYGTDTVAQHAVSLMLELARHTCAHIRAVADGQWTRSADWCLAVAPIEEMTGKTLGVVGVGRIGLALAKICQAMGMTVLAYDVAELPMDKRDGVTLNYVPLEQLLKQADVVSLHCPLTPATQNLMNKARLSQMKRTAWLINTSRGPLVDVAALGQALRGGVIGGAALDVLDAEPPASDHPLLGLANCIITPHIAWYARQSRSRLMTTCINNFKSFLAGKPTNVVNGVGA